MQDNEGRRPLKVRGTKYAQQIAQWLSSKDISPNSISVISVIFAALSALSLVLLPHANDYMQWLLPVLAAVFIQLRLLCNLFDGMVAVEGNKGTISGELFNDVPDRIADPLILIAAGYATSTYDWSHVLGWAAGLLAIFTAYVRTLSSSIGAPTDFRGPMAKQHRMALITIACLLTALEPLFWSQYHVLVVALIIVVVGAIITIFRRVSAAYQFLENNKDV